MNFVPLWTSILRSRKIGNLTDELRWTWIVCLLLAQETDHRHGSLPSADDIGFMHEPRLSPEEAMSRLSRLSRAGLLDERDGVWCVHDWEDWKQKPDPTAAARKRAQRERDRARPAAPSTQDAKPHEDRETPANITAPNGVTPVTDVTRDTECHKSHTLLNSTQLNSNTPPTPSRGAVCGDASPDGEDLEPFHSPPEREPPRTNPEAERVARIAEEALGDVSWAMWVRQRVGFGDRPAVLEAAIGEAVNSRVRSPTRKYVAAIVARLAVEGLPSRPATIPIKAEKTDAEKAAEVERDREVMRRTIERRKAYDARMRAQGGASGQHQSSQPAERRA